VKGKDTKPLNETDWYLSAMAADFTEDLNMEKDAIVKDRNTMHGHLM